MLTSYHTYHYYPVSEGDNSELIWDLVSAPSQGTYDVTSSHLNAQEWNLLPKWAM